MPPQLTASLPARRTDLVIRALGRQGQYVVKDRRAGTFFNLGAEEAFLLLQLDGKQTAERVLDAFETRFGQPLDEEDLADFLELAAEQRFLKTGGQGGRSEDERTDEVLRALRYWPLPGGTDEEPAALEGPVSDRPKRRQSLFFWRCSLYDPDALFNVLEPRLRFLWTKSFLVLSALGIVIAALLAWGGRLELAAQVPHGLHWRTVAIAWVVLAVLTTCHEFAHGLTCKHYGGEVHEVGFLLMYFMPCFYCNVSDSWLFTEKSKRLWVTLAGGYCDLVLWAFALFVWRLTLPDTLPNQAAWAALSICGMRIFLNVNPLLKLDGYYLLVDALELPNLRDQGRKRLMGYLRAILWGAPWPESEPRGHLLLIYGALSWTFSFVFLSVTIMGFGRVLGARAGGAGIGWTVLLGMASARRLFRGFTAGEVKTMILSRRRRALAWGFAIWSCFIVLATVRIEDWASAPFHFRPSRRAELRAPVAGFLKLVEHEEGDRVSPGERIVRMEVPDLDTKRAQKRAELRETKAKLRLLQVGPRPEEVVEQRQRVEREEAWRDLARYDLDHAREALAAELTELDEQVRQYRAETNRAADAHQRERKLVERRAVSSEQLQDTEKRWRVAQAQQAQAEARQDARKAQGTQKEEAELARRAKELADAQAALHLLTAGSRPEEIEAEAARLNRLEEEARYLDEIRGKLPLSSPVAGVVVTPRLRERIGQFFREGEVLCEVEALSEMEAEIAVPEEDLERVRPGQQVELKARALPFQTFVTQVDRVAPRSARGAALGPVTESAPAHGDEEPTTVLVYARAAGTSFDLRHGLTGHARVHLGRRPIGEILAYRILRIVRTEFWW